MSRLHIDTDINDISVYELCGELVVSFYERHVSGANVIKSCLARVFLTPEMAEKLQKELEYLFHDKDLREDKDAQR